MFGRAIFEDEQPLISTATRLELFLVAARRRGLADAAETDQLLVMLNIDTVPFDTAQLAIAQDAYRRYSGGRHGLNFGDCFSYALAKSLHAPLLFKGQDFARTDVRPAL